MLLLCNIIITCNSIDKNKVIEKVPIVRNEGKVNVNQVVEGKQNTSYDSLANLKIDTSTLKGKRKYLLNQFLINQQPSSPDYDTTFDLNYDGAKDYVIGYYGQAGNGIKNRVEVYLYDRDTKCYVLNEQLSSLPNPTFYIKQKKITSFYIAGSGSGERLQWLSGKWVPTKLFRVDNTGDKSVWKIEYPIAKKKKFIVAPFEMIPPSEVLETHIDF